jgi:hypothetical protein
MPPSRTAIFVIIVVQSAITAFFAPPAWSHGGGLDANGCHNDRKNGGYHCHRGNSNPATARPRRSQAYENPSSGSGAPESSNARSMETKDKIELAEKLLFRLGYDVDEPDGIQDEKTTKAVLLFQQSMGLPESGIITFRLIDALVAKVAE